MTDIYEGIRPRRKEGFPRRVHLVEAQASEADIKKKLQELKKKINETTDTYQHASEKSRNDFLREHGATTDYIRENGGYRLEFSTRQKWGKNCSIVCVKSLNRTTQ